MPSPPAGSAGSLGFWPPALARMPMHLEGEGPLGLPNCANASAEWSSWRSTVQPVCLIFPAACTPSPGSWRPDEAQITPLPALRWRLGPRILSTIPLLAPAVDNATTWPVCLLPCLKLLHSCHMTFFEAPIGLRKRVGSWLGEDWVPGPSMMEGCQDCSALAQQSRRPKGFDGIDGEKFHRPYHFTEPSIIVAYCTSRLTQAARRLFLAND